MTRILPVEAACRGALEVGGNVRGAIHRLSASRNVLQLFHIHSGTSIARTLIVVTQEDMPSGRDAGLLPGTGSG